MTRRGQWRSLTALVAAYALALQTLFAGLSHGAGASPADMLVLCTPSGDMPVGPPAPGDIPHRYDCCIAGPNILGKLLGPPPDAVAMPARSEAAADSWPSLATLFISRPHSPQTARGPPLA